MLRGFQNFDALATGSLPVGWTNGAGGNFIVGVDAISGSNVLTQSSPVEALVCIWTAVASVAGNIAAQFDKIISVSGNTSNAANLLISSDTAGTAGYITALVWSGSAWVLRLFKSPGGSAWSTVQDQAAGFVPVNGARIYKKIDLSITAGVGTIKVKVWSGTPDDEPASWNGTYTDNSPIACKYVGVFAGINGGAVLVNADNFYIGDSGDSFNFATIPVTDANLYFSHRNTFSDGNGAMQANNVKSGSTYARGLCPGWNIKAGITGSTTCYLWLDTTNMGSASPGDCPRIKTKFDDGVLATSQLVAGSTIVALATGQGTGNHVFQTTYYDSSPTIDQWNNPVGVKVLGLLVDAGGTSATPPTIFAKRLTFHTDSIGRGFCTDAGGNNGGDATHATPWMLASALGAEIGNVAYGGLGWGVATQGNLQPFFTPGNDTASSWNKYFAGQSALVNGLESPMPDDIMNQLGANDSLNSIPDATVTASVTGWLAAQRAAAPTSRISIILPFGGFKKSAILAGFTAYAGTVITSTVGNGLATRYTCTSDPIAFLYDLGSDATTGLTNPGHATAEAPNDGAGIHPSQARNGPLAAQEAAAIFSPGTVTVGQTEVYLTTRDQSGNPQSGVTINFQITSAPAGDTGNAYDTAVLKVVSNAEGLVQVSLPIGCGFEYWTTTGQPNSDTVPASGPYALKDLLGSYS